MSETRHDARLKRAKKWVIFETVVWILAIPLYLVTKNWVAAILAVVILLKIHQCYGIEKLFLRQGILLDDLMLALKKLDTATIREKVK